MLNIGASIDSRAVAEAQSGAEPLIEAVTLADSGRNASQFADSSGRQLQDMRARGEGVSPLALSLTDELRLTPAPKKESDDPFLVLIRHRLG